ncbi:NAD(P)-binding protein [Rhizopogon vinicolor AM-OR11-026]|uniref:NAD(P)-binding protein n=1 Tax=Rhizopogon vinicolor AM-OR11-026 TaxID=1314800 RepID=A0A1B7N0N2_9AGAM|nr:NAD(P)-binding protein [Rhizopogon vinicolor AM-OR11-026]
MSPSEYTRIFITGATGYIGGTVLSALLSNPKTDTFEITALIRSAEKAPLFNSIGVKTVIGSNSDLDTLTSLASEADVVVATANADDLNAAKAILRGLKKQHEQTKKVPILIHTSGTGVLIDQAAGNFTADKIYSDLDIPKIEALPKTQPHREVDIAVVAADEEGYARTYIILPSTIYGIANTSLVSLGLQNPHSQQIPLLIKTGLARGQGGVVGKGLNVWPSIHIDDTATLYITVFDAATKGPDETGHGREGFYFGENGEYSVGELSQAIAKLLHELGRGKSAEATVFTDEELDKYFGGAWFGSNSRARAERARLIGWNPAHNVDSLYASLMSEVEAIVAKQTA